MRYKMTATTIPSPVSIPQGEAPEPKPLVKNYFEGYPTLDVLLRFLQRRQQGVIFRTTLRLQTTLTTGRNVHNLVLKVSRPVTLAGAREITLEVDRGSLEYFAHTKGGLRAFDGEELRVIVLLAKKILSKHR